MRRVPEDFVCKAICRPTPTPYIIEVSPLPHSYVDTSLGEYSATGIACKRSHLGLLRPNVTIRHPPGIAMQTLPRSWVSVGEPA